MLQAPEGSEILSQAWLKGGVLALAFSSGDVLLRQDEAISTMTIAAGASLYSIAAFERGFVVGGTNASIAFMEPSTPAAKSALHIRSCMHMLHMVAHKERTSGVRP